MSLANAAEKEKDFSPAGRHVSFALCESNTLFFASPEPSR
jgi:hypothetical protein